MKPVNLRVGTATAIGSLPHRHIDAAVALALAASPDLPVAPSLPALEPREGMISQAAWGMRGVTVHADGTISIDGRLDPTEPFETPEAAGIDSVAFGAMRAFLEAVRHRAAPIKLQLTGPVTLALALIDAGARPDVAFATAGEAVRQRAAAIIDHAAWAAPLAPRVIFVDEPSLTAVSDSSFPIDRDQALDLVSSALVAVQTGAITGLHCCGDTDWRLALATGPQILSVPLTPSLTDHAGALGEHLDQGGWVAWGAVPTRQPIGANPDRLWRALSETWCELVQRGCDGLRLRDQALVTPECGLAVYDQLQAENILGQSGELAERVRRQSFGVRLAVGA